jgi:hypothetical protein
MTARNTESPLVLVRDAAGPRRTWRGKGVRFARVVSGYGRSRDLDARLERLAKARVIETIPTRVQLAIGAWDMLRFWISPAAADYYERQRIHYGFHQLLRFLDEPASLADPVGLFSTKDGIIGHLMQVVHANPVYDLQLLCMWDDGLDALESQLDAMLRGTHPRARSIGAIVEEPDYHANLLAFVQRWRRDPSIPPLLRGNIAAGFSDLERTFGTMTGAFRYFAKMPRTIAGALVHARRVRQFENMEDA